MSSFESTSLTSQFSSRLRSTPQSDACDSENRPRACDADFSYHNSLSNLRRPRTFDISRVKDEWSTRNSMPTDFTAPKKNPLGSYLDFMRLLLQLGVPGPVIVPSIDTPLGTGAQFSVSRNSFATGVRRFGDIVSYEVAVKRAHFTLPMVGRLDLTTDPKARRRLHDVQLEILALGHHDLRQHRNIVKLLSWSRDDQDWQFVPLLILELADDNLETFLKTEEYKHESRRLLTWTLKHTLCLDIAAGLDALHKTSIVHSDLKPSNVLIFQSDTETGYTAKLADFGLAVPENEDDYDFAEVIGGTEGWCAPEVQDYFDYGKRKIRLNLLPQTDLYSLGLVIFSVMFRFGRTVKDSCSPDLLSRVQKKLDDTKATSGINPPLLTALSSAFGLLLQWNAEKRPDSIGYPYSHLLNDSSPTYANWLQDEVSYSPEPLDLDFKPPKDETIYSWEFRELSTFHEVDIIASFTADPSSVPASILYSCFLKKTAEWGGHARSFPYHDEPVDVLLKAVISAAEGEFEPAQEVLLDVFEYLGRDMPADIEARMIEWLSNAVSSGSRMAASRLKTLDYASYEDAISNFRSRGGYNIYYSPVDPTAYTSFDLEGPACEHAKILLPNGDTLLHRAAALGDTKALSNLLAAFANDVNKLNSSGETALYKACMAGAYEAMYMLLSHGADPSLPSTITNLTCLHWATTFPESHIGEVIDALITHGANVHAIVSEDIPRYHFPYLFPAGTPLHWAVAMSSNIAIKKLIDRGADPMLRNKTDPYTFDEDIRSLTRFGGPDREPYSAPEGPVMGINAVDLAVRCRQPFLLEHLAEIGFGGKQDLDAVDEEGCSAFHRLCSGRRLLRTRSEIAFWSTVFEGSLQEQYHRVLATVKALLQLGLNAERVTTPLDSLRDGRTPLMLAVLAGDPIAVTALLENGCNPNTRNEHNENSLHIIKPSNPRNSNVEIVDRLLQYGIDTECRTDSGWTPLLNAALRGDLRFIGILLDRGINALDRVPLDDVCGYRSWCALLCREGSQGDAITMADWDAQVALFFYNRFASLAGSNSPQNELLHRADGDRGSLLHYAARAGMPKCISCFLSFGLKANSLKTNRSRRTNENGCRESYEYTTTPLDEACVKKERVKYGKLLSKPEVEETMRRYDEVIRLLEDAGGQLSASLA